MRRLAFVLVTLTACRDKNPPPAPAPTPSVVASVSASASAAPSASHAAVVTEPPARGLPPPKLGRYTPRPENCAKSSAWDALRPLPGFFERAWMYELTKDGKPAGFAYVHPPPPDPSCSIPECVTMTKRVASIDGPIVDVGDKPIETQGTRADAWDAAQGPCSLQLSVLAFRDAAGAVKAVKFDDGRMRARAPEPMKVFDGGVVVAWRTVRDGMDPHGGLTDTQLYAFENGEMRRVLHVENGNHTCWPREGADGMICKRSIFDVRVIEPGRAPFVELTSEIGSVGREEQVNVEIGRYRWDVASRRFKLEGKLRHEVRPAETRP